MTAFEKDEITRSLLNIQKSSMTMIQLSIAHLQVLKDKKPEELYGFIDRICPEILEEINNLEKNSTTDL